MQRHTTDMARKQIQARVPDGMAERINEYQETGEFMNETEAIRSLLRAGLEAEADHPTAEQAEQDLIADGGAIIRPLLRFMTSVGLGLGLIGFIGLYVGPLAFGLTISPEYLGFVIAAFLTGALTFLPLMTRYPERIDSRLWQFSGRIRGLVKA